MKLQPDTRLSCFVTGANHPANQSLAGHNFFQHRFCVLYNEISMTACNFLKTHSSDAFIMCMK